MDRLLPPRNAPEAKQRAWILVFTRMLKIFSDERFVDDMVQNNKISDDIDGMLSKCVAGNCFFSSSRRPIDRLTDRDFLYFSSSLSLSLSLSEGECSVCYALKAEQPG